MKLEQIRGQIDLIDEQIIDLLSQRANLAKQAFEAKKKNGQVSPFIPEREDRVFNRISKIANTKLGNSALGVFTEIVSLCRFLEKQIVILVLQNQLDKAETAITKRFGRCVCILPASDVNDLLTRLKTGALYGFIRKDTAEFDTIVAYDGISIVCEYSYQSLLQDAQDITYSLLKIS